MTFDRLYTNIKRKQQARIYKGIVCGNCPVREDCTKGKARTITQETREPLREKIRQRLDTPEGKAIYKKRMVSIEPVWGDMKFNKGFRAFRMRSKAKVNAEFMLLCIAHNIGKIHKLKAGESRLTDWPDTSNNRIIED